MAFAVSHWNILELDKSNSNPGKEFSGAYEIGMESKSLNIEKSLSIKFQKYVKFVSGSEKKTKN